MTRVKIVGTLMYSLSDTAQVDLQAITWENLASQRVHGHLSAAESNQQVLAANKSQMAATSTTKGHGRNNHACLLHLVQRSLVAHGPEKILQEGILNGSSS